ncbi:Uncharacterized protein C1orf177, partial [Mesitornis unicolor]
SDWAKAEKDSWFRRLPHFQFKEIKERRKRQQERLGPGTYNIRDFLQETRSSNRRGICDTREPRFGYASKDCFPPPGTYGLQGNPYARLEERAKRSTCTRGLMDSRTPNVAFPPCLQGSGLGPGTYHLRSSIGETLQRACGSSRRVLKDKSKPVKTSHAAPLSQERRDAKLSAGTVKSFVDELMLKENKKKGCFSTLPRNPRCPTERIFWATLSQCPKKVHTVGPGSYDPKPIERSVYSSKAPFQSSAKRFDKMYYRLFTGNENPVCVGRYDITKHEKYPEKMRYQSLYRNDRQYYLSYPKPVAKNNWSALISAPRCPDTSAELPAV